MTKDIVEKIEMVLGEAKISLVAPDENTPQDVSAVFDKMWKLQQKGRDTSAEMYKHVAELKKMGYWVANAGGQFKLNKLVNKGQWVKNASGVTKWRE